MGISRTQKYKSHGSGAIAISGTDLTDTATITAVDTDKTKVYFTGSGNSTGIGGSGYVSLTNATTITATRTYQNGSIVTTVGYSYWEEY